MRVPTTIIIAFSFFVLALCLSGCAIVITCEDVGCGSGEVCNVSTGQCEEIVRACTEDSCRAGEVCDEQTGQCRPERLRCTERFTCPDGQSCNANTGFCEPASRCETNAECGPAEQCNTSTQECEPRQCDGDGSCPVAYICDDESLCTPGCRPEQGGCAAGQFCLVLNDESIGRCVPNCSADSDCPFGQFCNLAAAPESRCVLEGACTVDADCRIDEVCSDGTCAQPPCSTDDDCLASQLCEVATRTCRSGACEEDDFGVGSTPNHSMQDAFGLDIGSYTQLTLCPGRSDWFAIDVRATDIVRARLRQYEAHPDLDLYVYGQNGEPLVANEQVGSVSSLKFAAGREQTVFLEIRSRDFVDATYDLTLTTEVCRNDTFEENDTIEESTVVPSSVGVPTDLALRACGFDEDWFRIRQQDPANGLRIDRVSSTPDLQVTLYSPDGEIYQVPRDDAFSALRSGTTGDWFVRAIGSLGQTGDYRLAFEILAPWMCEGAGEHGSASTALPSSIASPTIETFCPVEGSWEVDWVALQVPGDGILEAAVRPLGDAPDLEVVLFSALGEETTLVRPAVHRAGVEHLEAQVTTDRDWFLRISSAENVGRIVAEPRYELDYSIR